jgi:hypothetical protein
MTRWIVVPPDGSPLRASAPPLVVSFARATDADLRLIPLHDRPIQLRGAPANDFRFDIEIEQLMERERMPTADPLLAPVAPRRRSRGGQEPVGPGTPTPPADQ